MGKARSAKRHLGSLLSSRAFFLCTRMGSKCVPSRTTSKCRCGPALRPVEPTRPISAPNANAFTLAHFDARKLRVERLPAAAVVDDNGVSVFTLGRGKYHLAATCGDHRCSRRSGPVDPRVHFGDFKQRVAAQAEARRETNVVTAQRPSGFDWRTVWTTGWQLTSLCCVRGKEPRLTLRTNKAAPACFQLRLE